MSIQKITLLVGLPGSGKTTLGNFFIESYKGNGKVLFIDDIGVKANDAKSYLSNLDKEIEWLIISDVYFCKKEVLTQAKELLNNLYPNIDIEVLFFENSPEKCLYNIKKRIESGDDRKVEGLVKSLSKNYDISSTKTLKIKNK
jgi:adenylate kinase family enzyme